jgi:hypothetical protein
MKFLPKAVVEKIYLFCLDPADTYIINSLGDRINKHRYNDIDNHLKNSEAKRLQKIGTMDEDVEGFTFWHLALYCLAQEFLYIYGRSHFELVDSVVHLREDANTFAYRLRGFYKGSIGLERGGNIKEDAFSDKNIRKKIQEKGGDLIKVSFSHRGKFDVNVWKVCGATPPRVQVFARKFVCEKCVAEDRPNLLKDRCSWH